MRGGEDIGYQGKVPGARGIFDHSWEMKIRCRYGAESTGFDGQSQGRPAQMCSPTETVSEAWRKRWMILESNPFACAMGPTVEGGESEVESLKRETRAASFAIAEKVVAILN